MSEGEKRGGRGKKKKETSDVSCITEATQALREDPRRLVIWYNDHAWVIPADASDETSTLYIEGTSVINGQKLPISISALFGQMTYGELKEKIALGQAMDITMLIKRAI